MKKILSLFMATVMLISMFSVVGVTVAAQDDDVVGSEYTSMVYTPEDSSAFKTYKNCNGEWIAVENGYGGYTYEFKYDVADYRQNGSTLTFSGEGVEDLVFECTDGLNYANGEAVIDSNEINAEYVIREDETVYLEIEYNGLTAQQDIEFIETPVKEVEVKCGEIQLDAYAEGKYGSLSFGENAGKGYFCYNTTGNEELEITVTEADDVTLTLYGDGDGDLKFRTDGVNTWLNRGGEYTVKESQMYEEWSVGDKNLITIWYKGYPIDVEFSVNYAEGDKEVESIEYVRGNDKGFLFGIDGYTLDCAKPGCVCGNGEYAYYPAEERVPAEGDIINVTYAGEEEAVAFTCNQNGKFVSQDGARVNPYIYETQRDSHWEIGENPVYIYLGGKQATAQVKVEKINVEAIEFSHESRQAYENTWGYNDTNNLGEVYFRYEMPIYRNGTTLTLTLDNGEALVYKCTDGEFLSVETGDRLPFEINCNENQDDESWVVGEYDIEFTIEGCTDTVTLEVLKNPIREIEFVPAEEFKFVENRGGEWEELFDVDEETLDTYYYYGINDSYIFADGNKIIVTNDETGKKFTYIYNSDKDGFYTKSGKSLRKAYPVEWTEDQQDNHWVLGSDNYVYVSHMGHTAKVPVTIKAYEKAPMATITKCANGDGKIVLNWTEVKEADYYEVYRCEINAKGKVVKGAKWEAIATGIKALKYNDETVEADKYYKYMIHTRVVLDRNNDETERSKFESSKVVYTQYIEPIKGFEVKNTVYGVELNWDRYPGNKVVILRKAKGDKKWTRICTLNSDHDYVCEDVVKSGTEYQFAIRAVSGEIVSCYTYSDKITFLSAPTLKKPVNSENGVTVKWEKVKGAKSYNVYRRTSKTGWKLIKNTTKLSYLDTAVKNKSGTTYTYTVRAVAGKFRSGYNTGVKIERLSQPVLLSAKSTPKGIVVEWESVKGVDYYRVYRKTKGTSWQLLGTSSKEKISGTDPSAKKGVTYTYTIRAVSGNYVSSYSKTGVTCKDKY